MKYFCNGKKGFCDHDNECQSTCEFFDGRGGYYAEIVTNADRIRAMSDEELAGWLVMLKYGALTPWCDYRCEVERGHDCKKCLADWLRQPVKDGDTDGE